MASVQYLGNGVFRASWKDPLHVLPSGKPKQVNKRYHCLLQDGGKNTSPSKTEIKIRAREIQDEIDKLESAVPETPRPFDRRKSLMERPLAWVIRELMMRVPCRSKDPETVRASRNFLTHLAQWCENEQIHELTLGTFTARDVRRYVNYLGKTYAISTVRTRIRAIRSAWAILSQTQDKPIDNPWSGAYSYVDDIDKPVVSVGAFSVDWIRGFFKYLEHCKSLTKPDAKRNTPGGHLFASELYCFFFLILTTGWRKEDVRNLTWDAVDEENRVIKLLHKKTRKSSGASTILYLTEDIENVLDSLERKDERLFHFGKSLPARVLRDYVDANPPIGFDKQKVGKLTKRSHTIHSGRKSTITHLKMSGTSTDIVQYLVGHSGKDTEQVFYNRFAIAPKESTEKPLTRMADIVLGRTESTVESLIGQLAEALSIDKEKLRNVILSLTNEKRGE